jgi:diguanylate cyclase (GGDEF)-like protein
LKAPDDATSLRQSLLDLLEASPPHEERVLSDFERHHKSEGPLYSSILYILTHLSFTEAEARKHWRRIRAHRDRLQMELGRDVGTRVALLDYFVNLNRELRNPKVIEISIYERTERSAITDGLTGLYNHAHFLQALRREVQRSKRHGLQMALAIFDLDDFKKLNDTRGHLEGDKVLVRAATMIKETLREIDVAARYGGEEFAVTLPETSASGAFVVAERIRRSVEEQFRRRRGGPKVTLSGGVAAYPEDAETAEELIRRADEGLYRSKAAGKNRITLTQGERRKHLRVPASHPLFLEGSSGRKALARAKNVSEGGLLLSLEEAVPVGSKVSLEISSAGGPTTGLRGEVVRVDQTADREARFDVGIRLLGRRPKVLKNLHRLRSSARA